MADRVPLERCGVLRSQGPSRGMLYPPCMYGQPRRVSGPIRTGYFYGLARVLVALASDLYFLFVDPAHTPGWVLAAIAQYRTRLALALFLFLAILAALRVRPTRLDPGVPYRSLLLRDGALAATVVAIVFGAMVFLTTALQATLLADQVRAYAEEAAPRITAYVHELAQRFDEPSPTTVEEVESGLQPPTLRALGRSITNFVLRAVLLGTAGGLMGLLRGRPRTPRGGGAPPQVG